MGRTRLLGGGGLLGPHFYFELVRMARRGRTTAVRTLYVVALLTALFLVDTVAGQSARRINDYAHIARNFAYPLIVLQNVLVGLLAPVYFGTAFPDERSRGTLELLCMTHLTRWEIGFGKFAARYVQVAAMAAAGLPVLALVQFWGGFDMPFLLHHLACTLLLLASVGAFCFMLSTCFEKASDVLVCSYGVIAYPGGIACIVHAAVYEERARGPSGDAAWLTGLFWLAAFHGTVAGACLLIAVLRARVLRFGPTDRAKEQPPPMPAPRPRKKRRRHGHARPIPDNALLWKECASDRLWPNLTARKAAVIAAVVVVVLTVPGWLLGAHGGFDQHAHGAAAVFAVFQTVVIFYLYAIGFAYVVCATFAAAGSVAHERQARTLTSLLLVPVSRHELLGYKWLGAVVKFWPFLLVAGAAAAATLTSPVLPWWVGPLMLLGPVPFVAFCTALGMFVSVRSRTTLGANLRLCGVLGALVAAHGFILLNWRTVHLGLVRAAEFAGLETEGTALSDPALALAMVPLVEALLCPVLAGLLWWGAVRYFERWGDELPA